MMRMESAATHQSPKRKACDIHEVPCATVTRATSTPQEAIGAEAMRMQRGVPPYDVAPFALFVAGKHASPTVAEAQRAVAALQHDAALADPAVQSLLFVTDLCVRNTGTFVDTDDYLLMLVLCHLVAKRALLCVRSLTIVLSARKKHGDCTTPADVLALFYDELFARGMSLVADADACTLTVRYNANVGLTIRVFEQLEQTVPSPLLCDDAGKPRKARAADLVGPAFEAANSSIRELNAPLRAHVMALEGLASFQCGPLDVPLAALLLERSMHVGSVSAGSGVNGGDGKPHDVDSSHRGGLVLDAAAADGRVSDLRPQLTRRLRVTDFLVQLAGDKMAKALATTVYRSFAIPFIQRPTADAPDTKRALTLMLRLCDSNAQTSLDPDTFVEVVALCHAQTGRVCIGDALRALGCTLVDPGAVGYAAWFALTCVSNIIGLDREPGEPVSLGTAGLRDVSYTATTRLTDILRASGIHASFVLSECARAMVAESMPEHKGLTTFGDLFVAIMVGMAGRLCFTLAIAGKCGVQASVPPTEPTLTEHGLYMTEPVVFGAEKWWLSKIIFHFKKKKNDSNGPKCPKVPQGTHLSQGHPKAPRAFCRLLFFHTCGVHPLHGVRKGPRARFF